MLIFNNLGVHFRFKVRSILDLPGCILNAKITIIDEIEHYLKYVIRLDLTDSVDFYENCRVLTETEKNNEKRRFLTECVNFNDKRRISPK